MQIEESFRDLKGPAYGFGLRHCRSRSPKRLDILLLISLLAEIVLWCIGLKKRVITCSKIKLKPLFFLLHLNAFLEY
ncbi:hypothetical protein K6Y31_21760 [Motilimonas cestriensis]|uniref:Transposase n=1 Tax=Motilimonas cestriensis TaxID=2742685 RepID=A0ABS8WED7_9GAMM|nr:hypothetical protein [Motilimonas cestriensis]